MAFKTVMQQEQSQKLIKGVVFTEIVVLRRWGSCTQEFGFINGVDNVN